MSKNDGGPAFPITEGHLVDTRLGVTAESRIVQGGMSLRDYFAATALAGLVNTEPVADENDSEVPARQVAKDAYRLADAMLAERAK